MHQQTKLVVSLFTELYLEHYMLRTAEKQTVSITGRNAGLSLVQNRNCLGKCVLMARVGLKEAYGPTV